MKTGGERRAPRLPGGFSLPPLGLHQWLAMGIVAVALWAVGMLWLGMQAGEQWVGSWRQDVRFHVYLDGGDERKLAMLAAHLAGLPGVASARVVPRAEMRAWLRQWAGGDVRELNDLLGALPGTVEVTPARDADEFIYADVRDAAERMGARANPGEARLAAARKWLADLGGLLWFVTWVAALAMAVVISNTLRMMLLSRADEVCLMRLLGAEEWFVRMPFVLEGMLLGTGAGLLGWGLLWPVAMGAEDWLAALDVRLDLASMVWPLLAGGVASGGLGAWIATLQMPDRG